LIALSIRSRIQAVTSRDTTRRPDVRRMKLLNEEVVRWPLPPLHGRFWGPESDSEPEYQRQAGTREHPTPPPSSSPRRVPTPQEARHSSSPWTTKEKPPPRRIRTPLKSVWKGPLPPRRIMPGRPSATSSSLPSPGRARVAIRFLRLIRILCVFKRRQHRGHIQSGSWLNPYRGRRLRPSQSRREPAIPNADS
jgi:hypothetical protein